LILVYYSQFIFGLILVTLYGTGKGREGGNYLRK